ncbi:UDP-N-acetylmuramate dehydrogenase [Brevibacterium moorei]|uniref:UDP-N-acetylmuramate dehydrogenase n=1 Tax=Brevibacterium moorei TaxID=2968457 RepID=UPI00211B9CCA|nr:UDP-N-acetylmuramate dehydrogenase [Brevibacterium sp. 68QC2CO]MCQ9385606.1 UDP-N-acetylmuramate dehydrogenase [Brevibacterium sp. 68QC2CO]
MTGDRPAPGTSSTGGTAAVPGTLAELTTFHLGGPLPDLTVAHTAEDLADFGRAHPLDPSAHGDPAVLFIGGGSNILAGDSGFAGPACLVATRGIQESAHGTRTLVTAQAGEVWDEFVAWTLDHGLSGLEALSGIPGTVGAAPVQNIGAYGCEVAELIESVRVFDRVAGQAQRLPAERLQFSYRNSLLKRAAAEFGEPRYIVLEVCFALERGRESAPVRYGQLAAELEVAIGQTADPAAVRTAVLHLRASKGMVLDPADHDTWSAGSFFTNPIVARDFVLPDGAPSYPVHDPLTGVVDPQVQKTSAAWLIDHAGFAKGYGLPRADGRPPVASLSTKHTLALTNRGAARTADLLELARRIQAGVHERFGIVLVPEPNLVGCSLDSGE